MFLLACVKADRFLCISSTSFQTYANDTNSCSIAKNIIKDLRNRKKVIIFVAQIGNWALETIF